MDRGQVVLGRNGAPRRNIMELTKLIVGGSLIGLAAAGLFLANGRIAGNSGISGGLMGARRGDIAWRWSWLAGLVAGGALIWQKLPDAFATTAPSSLSTLLLAGLLIGFGSRLGNGCTSGHGLCGIARLSKRSIVATSLFIISGALTYALVHGRIG